METLPQKVYCTRPAFCSESASICKGAVLVHLSAFRTDVDHLHSGSMATWRFPRKLEVNRVLLIVFPFTSGTPSSIVAQLDAAKSCLASPQAALEAGCHLQPHNKANCFHEEFAAFHASSQYLRGVTSGVTPRCAPPPLSAVGVAGFPQSMASPGLETFLEGLPR